MEKFLIGIKEGMTQIIEKNDQVVPVTVIKVESMQVLKIKTNESDSYESVVVGFGSVNEKKCNRPLKGQFTTRNLAVKKNIKEYRVNDVAKFQEGQEISMDMFSLNEEVHARGVTIGRGFTGTIKRWNFRRGPMTHGSKKHRGPGSIGAGTGYSRVLKGKKMSGHYGNEYVTIKNLKIVKLDIERGLIYLKGSVPGKRNNLIYIYK